MEVVVGVKGKEKELKGELFHRIGAWCPGEAEGWMLDWWETGGIRKVGPKSVNPHI
jgi:hypothetical protein